MSLLMFPPYGIQVLKIILERSWKFEVKHCKTWFEFCVQLLI